jgi:hypothetical protein
MDREFEDREKCVAFLRSYFDIFLGHDHAAELADEVADLRRQDAPKAPEPNSDGFEFIIPGIRWVIKDSDLALFNSIIDSVKAAVPAGLLAGSVTQGAILGSALGVMVIVLKSAHRALKKGVILTPLQYEVLVALRSTAPSGVEKHQLLHHVKAIRRHKGENTYLGDTEIHSALEELQKVALPDGSVVSFVSTDAKGVLRAQEV